MSHWNRVQGDIDDTVVVRLDGGVANFLAATGVVGHVSYNGAAFVTLAGTLDIPNRLATINLGSSPAGWLIAATVGCWQLHTVVTFAGGATKTWPEKGADEITVGLP